MEALLNINILALQKDTSKMFRGHKKFMNTDFGSMLLLSVLHLLRRSKQRYIFQYTLHLLKNVSKFQGSSVYVFSGIISVSPVTKQRKHLSSRKKLVIAREPHKGDTRDTRRPLSRNARTSSRRKPRSQCPLSNVRTGEPIKMFDSKSGSVWTRRLPAILISFSDNMASEHNKFRFPSLTSEEAVANCKSMFGSQVALSVDDLMRPQVCEQFRFCFGNEDSWNSSVQITSL